jgi:hypothetical protein
LIGLSREAQNIASNIQMAVNQSLSKICLTGEWADEQLFLHFAN